MSFCSTIASIVQIEPQLSAVELATSSPMPGVRARSRKSSGTELLGEIARTYPRREFSPKNRRPAETNRGNATGAALPKATSEPLYSSPENAAAIASVFI